MELGSTTLRRVAVVVGLTLAWPATARAQGAERRAAAEELFNAARRSMDSGDYAAACPKLEQSQELDPSVGTLGWLGRCYEQQGKIASAWATCRLAASLAERRNDLPRRDLALEREKALEPQVSRLVLDASAVSAVEGVSILRNGVPVPLELWAGAPVDPGEHVIEARAPGHTPVSVRVSIAAGALRETAVIPAFSPVESATPAAAGPAPAPVSPVATSTTLPPPEQPRADAAPRNSGGPSAQVIAAYAAAGAGVLGLGLGAVFYVQRNDAVGERDEACPKVPRGNCPSEQARQAYKAHRDDAQRAATRATVSTAVGAALVATGVVLWLTAPKAEERAVALTPLLLTEGGGLRLESTW